VVAVAVVLALAGLLFTTSAHTARGTDLRPGERGDLVDLIREQESRVAQHTAELAQLRRDVDSGTSRAAERDARVAAARRASVPLESAAGMQAVTGPAVQVTLDDAPRRDRSELPPEIGPDDLVVHQQDVQAVVNALWAGGAEAVQLMDQRVISTSAVRCVGNTLILQGRVYSPPYVVTAIGPVEQMRSALDSSEAVQIYQQFVDAVGLGYHVEDKAAATLPAYTGAIDMLYAKAGS
jgi:uncharacterized protein YlxW (UPF0749 family)